MIWHDFELKVVCSGRPFQSWWDQTLPVSDVRAWKQIPGQAQKSQQQTGWCCGCGSVYKKLINSQSKKEIENFIQAILKIITWQMGFQKALSTALKEMKEEASIHVILKREHAIKHTSQ